MSCAIGLLHLFVTGPMWWFLLFRILKLTKAGELEWGVFWAYVPVSIIALIATVITKVIAAKFFEE